MLFFENQCFPVVVFDGFAVFLISVITEGNQGGVPIVGDTQVLCFLSVVRSLGAVIFFSLFHVDPLGLLPTELGTPLILARRCLGGEFEPILVLDISGVTGRI